ILADRILRQADVHPEEWLCIPVKGLRRVTCVSHQVRCPVEKALSLSGITEARICLRRLECVVRDLRRMRSRSPQRRRRSAYGRAVATLQQREITAIAGRGRCEDAIFQFI